MTYTTKLLRDELEEILAQKKQMLTTSDAKLPSELLNIILAFGNEEEEFWKQKCQVYFTKALTQDFTREKPTNRTFKSFFQDNVRCTFKKADSEDARGCLKLISYEAQKDIEFMKSLVEKNWKVFEHVGFKTKENIDVLAAALKGNKKALKYASDKTFSKTRDFDAAFAAKIMISVFLAAAAITAVVCLMVLGLHCPAAGLCLFGALFMTLAAILAIGLGGETVTMKLNTRQAFFKSSEQSPEGVKEDDFLEETNGTNGHSTQT